MKNDLKNNCIYFLKKKFIKYCLIGCSGALLDFILYSIFINYFSYKYLFANAISTSIGITNNFFLNAYFNFKITDNLFKRFISFYSIGIFGLLISEGFLYVFVEYLKINSIFSKIISIFVITFIQFFLNKFITFKYNKEREDGEFSSCNARLQ